MNKAVFNFCFNIYAALLNNSCVWINTLLPKERKIFFPGECPLKRLPDQRFSRHKNFLCVLSLSLQ
jgi:hypothetical protein